MIKYRYPTNYIGITGLYKKGSHYGLDLGWTSKIEGFGKNQNIYASADGIVYATHDKDTTGKSWGNYIKIKHDDNTYTMYAHLKTGSLKVKKGDRVQQGDIIANMGATGQATGNHLHFEIYIGGVGTSYRVDPLPITYVYSGQVVADGDKDKVKYYNPEPTESNIIKALNKLSEVEKTITEIKDLLSEVK